jgi:hypothetical protein
MVKNLIRISRRRLSLETNQPEKEKERERIFFCHHLVHVCELKEKREKLLSLNSQIDDSRRFFFLSE